MFNRLPFDRRSRCSPVEIEDVHISMSSFPVSLALRDDDVIKTIPFDRSCVTMAKYDTFSYRDFSIQSLLQSGNIDKLKYVRIAGDVDVSEQNINNLLDAVDAESAAAKSE